MHDKIEAVLKSPLTIPIVIGVTSFAGGLGLGYFLGKRKIVEVEVHELPAAVKVDFDVEVEETEAKRPPRVVIEAKDAVEQGIVRVNNLSELRPSMLSEENEATITWAEVADDNEPDDIVVIEDTPINNWDWDEELEHRTELAPYIIHQEEFYANEQNYTQMSLAYYTGDDTLADEDDAPVYNYTNIVGELTFGHGAGEENVVYIRNHERKAEYEVTRLDGYYAVEILGYDIEQNAEASDIKHSKHIKFRME